MAVLFVLYIPIETEEETGSIISQGHNSGAAENDMDDILNADEQNNSLHKSNSGVSFCGGLSSKVKSDTDFDTEHLCESNNASDVSPQHIQKSHVVCAMGDTEDTNAGSGSKGNVMPDCVSAEDPDVANILNEEASLMVNEAGEAPEALGDAQVETGKDGDEQMEELEAEGFLSEEGLVYTTECVTLEQVWAGVTHCRFFESV